MAGDTALFRETSVPHVYGTSRGHSPVRYSAPAFQAQASSQRDSPSPDRVRLQLEPMRSPSPYGAQRSTTPHGQAKQYNYVRFDNSQQSVGPPKPVEPPMDRFRSEDAAATGRRVLEEDELQELRDVFDRYDIDGTGFIYDWELKLAVDEIEHGVIPDTKEDLLAAREQLKACGLGNRGRVTFYSLVHAVTPAFAHLSLEELAAFRRLFDLYDGERTGFISDNDMLHALGGANDDIDSMAPVKRSQGRTKEPRRNISFATFTRTLRAKGVSPMVRLEEIEQEDGALKAFPTQGTLRGREFEFIVGDSGNTVTFDSKEGLDYDIRSRSPARGGATSASLVDDTAASGPRETADGATQVTSAPPTPKTQALIEHVRSSEMGKKAARTRKGETVSRSSVVGRAASLTRRYGPIFEEDYEPVDEDGPMDAEVAGVLSRAAAKGVKEASGKKQKPAPVKRSASAKEMSRPVLRPASDKGPTWGAVKEKTPVGRPGPTAELAPDELVTNLVDIQARADALAAEMESQQQDQGTEAACVNGDPSGLTLMEGNEALGIGGVVEFKFKIDEDGNTLAWERAWSPDKMHKGTGRKMRRRKSDIETQAGGQQSFYSPSQHLVGGENTTKAERMVTDAINNVMSEITLEGDQAERAASPVLPGPARSATPRGHGKGSEWKQAAADKPRPHSQAAKRHVTSSPMTLTKAKSSSRLSEPAPKTRMSSSRGRSTGTPLSSQPAPAETAILESPRPTPPRQWPRTAIASELYPDCEDEAIYRVTGQRTARQLQKIEEARRAEVMRKRKEKVDEVMKVHRFEQTVLNNLVDSAIFLSKNALFMDMVPDVLVERAIMEARNTVWLEMWDESPRMDRFVADLLEVAIEEEFEHDVEVMEEVADEVALEGVADIMETASCVEEVRAANMIGAALAEAMGDDGDDYEDDDYEDDDYEAEGDEGDEDGEGGEGSHDDARDSKPHTKAKGRGARKHKVGKAEDESTLARRVSDTFSQNVLEGAIDSVDGDNRRDIGVVRRYVNEYCDRLLKDVAAEVANRLDEDAESSAAVLAAQEAAEDALKHERTALNAMLGDISGIPNAETAAMKAMVGDVDAIPTAEKTAMNAMLGDISSMPTAKNTPSGSGGVEGGDGQDGEGSEGTIDQEAITNPDTYITSMPSARVTTPGRTEEAPSGRPWRDNIPTLGEIKKMKDRARRSSMAVARKSLSQAEMSVPNWISGSTSRKMGGAPVAADSNLKHIQKELADITKEMSGAVFDYNNIRTTPGASTPDWDYPGIIREVSELNRGKNRGMVKRDSIENIQDEVPLDSRGAVMQWGVEEVCQWLEKMDLGAYVGTFKSHHINGGALLNLSGKILKREMGVVSVGHRHTIMTAISHCADNGPQTSEENASGDSGRGSTVVPHWPEISVEVPDLSFLPELRPGETPYPFKAGDCSQVDPEQNESYFLVQNLKPSLANSQSELLHTFRNLEAVMSGKHTPRSQAITAQLIASNNTAAFRLIKKGQFTTAFGLMKEADRLCHEKGVSREMRVWTLSNFALYFCRRNKGRVALTYVQRILRHAKSSGSERLVALADLLYSGVLHPLGVREKALSITERRDTIKLGIQRLMVALGRFRDDAVRRAYTCEPSITGSGPLASPEYFISVANYNIAAAQAAIHKYSDAHISVSTAVTVGRAVLAPGHSLLRQMENSLTSIAGKAPSQKSVYAGQLAVVVARSPGAAGGGFTTPSFTNMSGGADTPVEPKGSKGWVFDIAGVTQPDESDPPAPPAAKPKPKPPSTKVPMRGGAKMKKGGRTLKVKVFNHHDRRPLMVTSPTKIPENMDPSEAFEFVSEYPTPRRKEDMGRGVGKVFSANKAKPAPVYNLAFSVKTQEQALRPGAESEQALVNRELSAEVMGIAAEAGSPMVSVPNRYTQSVLNSPSRASPTKQGKAMRAYISPAAKIFMRFQRARLREQAAEQEEIMRDVEAEARQEDIGRMFGEDDPGIVDDLERIASFVPTPMSRRRSLSFGNRPVPQVPETPMNSPRPMATAPPQAEKQEAAPEEEVQQEAETSSANVDQDAGNAAPHGRTASLASLKDSLTNAEGRVDLDPSMHIDVQGKHAEVKARKVLMGTDLAEVLGKQSAERTMMGQIPPAIRSGTASPQEPGESGDAAPGDDQVPLSLPSRSRTVSEHSVASVAGDARDTEEKKGQPRSNEGAVSGSMTQRSHRPKKPGSARPTAPRRAATARHRKQQVPNAHYWEVPYESPKYRRLSPPRPTHTTNFEFLKKCTRVNPNINKKYLLPYLSPARPQTCHPPRAAHWLSEM